MREYFRFLLEHGYLQALPAQGVSTPNKERKSRTYLQPDEYNKLLAQASRNSRDYAILQAGLRVRELTDLRLDDVDLAGRTLTIRGKGQVTRTIELEKKGVQALKN